MKGEEGTIELDAALFAGFRALSLPFADAENARQIVRIVCAIV